MSNKRFRLWLASLPWRATNEIKTAAPMLDTLEIEGRTITADALLTQRELARYRMEDRRANYQFTVKGNQPNLFDDLTFYFQNSPKAVDFTHIGSGDHGRIETRKIWVTTALNQHPNFPHVHQAFMIERESIIKRQAK